MGNQPVQLTGLDNKVSSSSHDEGVKLGQQYKTKMHLF